jgi:hypothetical protein
MSIRSRGGPGTHEHASHHAAPGHYISRGHATVSALIGGRVSGGAAVGAELQLARFERVDAGVDVVFS